MSHDPIPELIRLLGPAVLIAWPKGTKGTNRKWKHLTLAHMTPEYLAKLPNGNIGVALGAKSGNLVALDVDADGMVAPFLTANPFLKNTLRTHGARGAVFWLRMTGEYPAKTVKLKTVSGEDCGEFRSNGSQSIIYGIHPDTGQPYEVVNMAKPVAVDFADIVWPSQISNAPTVDFQKTASDTEIQSDRVTEAISVTPSSLSSPSLCLTVYSVEHAVELALPSKSNQNHDRLFILARAVKSLETQTGKFTPAQLRDVFSRWYQRAAGFLRPEQTRDDYMTEFMNAYASAKKPLGEGAITDAWKLAQEKPLPPEAIEMFEDDKLRLVVALCRELQIVAGNGPFYLSARTLQGLLKQDGHATAARWLRSLCVLQVIAEVEKGGGNRASRYRYQLPLAS
jgi:hypothetical protein